jgi:hypothetical protein
VGVGGWGWASRRPPKEGVGGWVGKGPVARKNTVCVSVNPIGIPSDFISKIAFLTILTLPITFLSRIRRSCALGRVRSRHAG